MPAQYEIDFPRRVILSSARGLLTEEDLVSHQTMLRADPFFDGSFDQLWDFSEVTQVAVEADMVRQLAHARSFEPGARRAVVAPSDLTFGMARMFQLSHDGAPEEMRIFRDLAAALRWLGLDD